MESRFIPEAAQADVLLDIDLTPRWRRFVGFVIDWFVQVLLTLLLLQLTGVELGGSGTLQAPAATRFIQAVVGLLYYVGFIAFRGQTPGKMLLRTRVVMSRTGGTPNIKAAVIRWLIPGVWTFLPGVSVAWLVTYGWLAVDLRRQGLHDKAARTVVVGAA